MGLCDICGSPGLGTIVSADQIREAVFAKGFNPFALGLAKTPSTLVPDEKFYEGWKNSIVAQDSSDWNICPRCMTKLQDYLKGAPKPTGVKKSTVSLDPTVSRKAGTSAELKYKRTKQSKSKQPHKTPTEKNNIEKIDSILIVISLIITVILCLIIWDIWGLMACIGWAFLGFFLIAIILFTITEKILGVDLFGKKRKVKRKLPRNVKGSYTKADAVTKTSDGESFRPIEDVNAEFNIGDVLLNRYKIIDIKKGGMGLVYISVDNKTNNLIAIKTFQKQFLQDDRVVDAFLREAETWVNLGKHTNLVWAKGIVRIDGKPYIFIEYVDGGTLADRIKNGNISFEKGVDFGIQICTGMAYAYDKLGTIHRDIKPLNILLSSDDTIKITDFGLVKTAEYQGATEFLTSKYASPEQIKEGLKKGGDSKLDTRSDIYSFGLVLYNLFTNGKMPFSKGVDESWEHCHLYKQPTKIKKHNPDLPDELCDIIMRSLNKDTRERWSNFLELQQKMIEVYESLTGTKYLIEGKEEKIDDSNIDGSRGELGRTAELYGKYEAANKYYKKALNGCLERGDKQGQSACYINMGKVALAKSDYKKALEYFNNALQINLTLGDKQVQSGCYTNMGIVSQRKGDYDQALEYYNKSLKIASIIGDKEVQSASYMNMGLIAQRKGNYDQALEYFNKSLKINLALGDKQVQSACYINMGVIVKIRGDHKQALEYYKKALQIDIALGDKQGQCKCYGALGNVAAAEGDFDQALEYYNQSLKIALALEDKQVQSMLYTNLGAVSVSRGNSNQALGYFNKSLQIKKDLGDEPGRAMCYTNMGVIARKNADYNQALEYYNNSLKIALALGDKQVQSGCYRNMGNVAVDKDDYDQALEYFKKAMEINRIMGLDTSELEKMIREVKRMM